MCCARAATPLDRSHPSHTFTPLKASISHTSQKTGACARRPIVASSSLLRRLLRRRGSTRTRTKRVNDHTHTRAAMDARKRAAAAAGAGPTRAGDNDEPELLLGLEASSMVRVVCWCWCVPSGRPPTWSDDVPTPRVSFRRKQQHNRRCWPSTTPRWGSSGRSRSGRPSSRRWAVSERERQRERETDRHR